MKKKRKVWPWILSACLVTFLAVVFVTKFRGQASESTELASWRVDYGTVIRSITSSGKLRSADTIGVEAEELEIESITVSVGDPVQAGDVLALYDADSIQERISALYEELSSLDSQIAVRQTGDTVAAPTEGRIKALYVEAGDELDAVMREHGALALLSADGKMQVEITDAEGLSIGKTLTVEWDEGSTNGTVANLTPDGALITLNDKGIPMGAVATVWDGDTELGQGTLEVHAPVYVYASGGTVKTVHVDLNQWVYQGGTLFTLADKPESTSYADSLRQREDIAEEIAALYALQDDPVITAPADGVVADIQAAEGRSTTGDAFTLHTGGAVKMTVSVDEFDIGVVSLEQSAVITLDAFPGESFPATVTHISHIGTSSGSITTYDVELILEADARLLEGMNGSAVITAQEKENVLLIPMEAIHEDESGLFVLVQAGEGTERREIQTGISDGVSVEVTDGLVQGETIRYQAAAVVNEYPFGPPPFMN